MAADDDKVWNGVRVMAPAKRGLIAAGIVTLDDLAMWTRADVGELHGVGPRALALLDDALVTSGRTFRSR